MIGQFEQMQIGNTIIRNSDLPLGVKLDLMGDDAARDILDVAAGRKRVKVIYMTDISLHMGVDPGPIEYQYKGAKT